MVKERLIGATLILAIAILVGVGMWRIEAREAAMNVAVVRRPEGVMGTVCTLAAVVPENEQQPARDLLLRAETRLRRAEAMMSNWLEDSEVSRLNAARPGVEAPLSSETRRVIGVARRVFEETDGTFDITCRPQVAVWQKAGESGQLPSDGQRMDSRLNSNWELVELTEGGVIKRSETVRIDLGGIAKGYAIDQALKCLRRAELRGGLVEIGGDLACFGQQADGQPWRVEIRHPDYLDSLTRLRVLDRAIATSGNYARYTEIEGRRYSHIIDPRTCEPAVAAESVTAVAATAMMADVWATAISILGVDGFARLPDGVDVLLVVETEGDSRLVCTPGFQQYFDGPAPEGLEVWKSS